MSDVRHFRLHWLGGKAEDISIKHDGDSMEAAVAAMNAAGIGAGALRALDYWEELKEPAVAAPQRPARCPK